jgi:NAD(P)-dependent dehydrogenase (short-subunit alcohol dehydrogenase family)
MKNRKSLKLANLEKSTAIITGGGGLLGRIYTATLLEAGAKVIIIDKKIDENKIEKLIKKESKINQEKIKNIEFVECDITNPIQVNDIFIKLDKSLKDLKILVNNASLVKQVGKEDLVDTYKPFLKMKVEDWEEYFSVDLTGTLLICQKCIPHMKNNGRLYKFFNKKLSKKMKSQGIEIEKPIGYSISKSGILNLTRFLATKFAENKIRVNTLTLGGVYADNPPEFVKDYSEKTPLKRMANKEEYAGPLLFLASEMSSYMTGSNLIVDGGWSAW